MNSHQPLRPLGTDSITSLLSRVRIAAWACAPLGVSGFVLVAAAVSTVLQERFLPQGTVPWRLYWWVENLICIALSMAVPAAYLVAATRLRDDRLLWGHNRRFWLVVIGCSFGLGVLVATLLLAFILVLAGDGA